MSTANIPKHLSVVEFHEWLVEALDTVNSHEEPSHTDYQGCEQCGWIVHEAGDLASYLGMPALHEKSLKVAPFCDSVDAGICGYACYPAAAQTFLAECIQHCGNTTSSPNTEAGAARKPQSHNGLGGAIKNCFEKAYDWWYWGQHELGGRATDQAVYDWAVQKAVADGETLPEFNTWARYLRKERTRRGEQKHWHRQVPLS